MKISEEGGEIASSAPARDKSLSSLPVLMRIGLWVENIMTGIYRGILLVRLGYCNPCMTKPLSFLFNSRPPSPPMGERYAQHFLHITRSFAYQHRCHITAQRVIAA